MGFFDDVDDLGIVENHIQQVVTLEESESKRMLRTYREVRQELRDRLDTLPGDTFTSQQLRGYLVQVESAILAMNHALDQEMSDAAEVALEKSIKDSLTEIKRFQKEFEGAVTPISLNRGLIISDTKSLLVNQYQSSLSAYSGGVLQDVTRNLTQLSLTGMPSSEASKRLSRFFVGEEWKLERLVRTELHSVYNLGKLRSLTDTKDDFIPDLKKTLIHPMDSRTGKDSIALAALNPIVDIDEPFRFTFNGKLREFMAPPDRPNDRAVLVAFREEWSQPSTKRAANA